MLDGPLSLDILVLDCGQVSAVSGVMDNFWQKRGCI